MSVPVLRDALRVFNCDIVQMFGQTECPPITCLTPADHRRALAGKEYLLSSVGKAQPGVIIEIIDLDGHPVSVGTTGEICVRHEAVMTGYWNEPEMTAEAQRGGWHHTGDVGYLDEDGYLFIVDRLKDMVISGGYNVYCREVERVLESMPEISMVAVIGVPSERWGEEVKAIISLNPGTSLDFAQVRRHCSEHLASYKCPKSVEFIDSFALSVTGKIVKSALREQYGRSPVSSPDADTARPG
jgi:acyl-CoA synthetase (AMP-forming)/AMP-acid ligase II